MIERIGTFLAMDGYGAFVWPAFGLSAVVLVWLLVATLRQLHARQRALAELQAPSPRRERPRAAAKEAPR